MKPAKQLLLGLIALGLSTPAFADDGFVYEPDQRGGWKAELDILYLRPSTSDLVYATKINRILTLPPPADFEAQNATISPGFHWGLYAQIGYLFPCGGNDLTLGYTYLPNNATIESITANPPRPPLLPVPPFSSIIVLPFNEVVSPGGAIAFSFAQGQAKFNLNAVDIEAGQRFTTDNYDMRMFAGLRYANMDHSLKTLVSGPSLLPTQPITGNQEFDSQFSGWGPRLGVDARYCLSGGFGIDANVSSALLVSHVDASYEATLFVPGLDPIRFQTQNNEANRLVPVLEAKMGIDYFYTMSSWCNSSLVFEFGYQLTNYFNAIDRPRIVDSADGSFIFQNTTHDVGFDGFYLGVKYYA